MMKRIHLRISALMLLVLVNVAFVAPAFAQERVLARAGEARVPIYQDDLDQARRRALEQAQEQILREVIRELLAPEWAALYEPDLAKRVLSRLDRYISAYRVRRLETSLDRTQYFAALEAQVERAVLINDLRDMALPILGDRRIPIVLLFRSDDPVLSVAEARNAVIEHFTARLALLNLEVQKTFAVQSPTAPLLDNPFGNQEARQAWLAGLGSNAPAAAYVTFARSAPGTGSPFALAVRFYLMRDGVPLADFSQQGKAAPAGPVTAAMTRQVLLPDVVGPLLNQIQPGSVGNPTAWGTQATSLELRVYGFKSVYDEEAFERDFFGQGSAFSQFVLSRLAADSVTYEGVFRGDRNRVEREWAGRAVGAFRVREVFWNNGTLEFFVERQEQPEIHELVPFPPESRTPAVTALFDDYLKARPDSPLATEPVYGEAEDNGRFDRANALLFNLPIYGFVDSRGDADVYVAEALRPGETIVVEWYRLGRTNLSPTLRLFDEEGILTRTAYATGGELKFEFTVPAAAHRAYLEVADRFGYLTADAGGYLSYHYVMWVRRDAPDTPPPPPYVAGPPALPAPSGPAAAVTTPVSPAALPQAAPPSPAQAQPKPRSATPPAAPRVTAPAAMATSPPPAPQVAAPGPAAAKPASKRAEASQARPKKPAAATAAKPKPAAKPKTAVPDSGSKSKPKTANPAPAKPAEQ
jgi:hypothetical protein